MATSGVRAGGLLLRSVALRLCFRVSQCIAGRGRSPLGGSGERFAQPGDAVSEVSVRVGPVSFRSRRAVVEAAPSSPIDADSPPS